MKILPMSEEKNKPENTEIEKEIFHQLYQWALGYLARFEAPRKKLHQKMEEKYKKLSNLLNQESYDRLCADVLNKLEEKKYLSNQRYGRMRLISLIQRGKSLRLAEMDLKQNGLSSVEISQLIEELNKELEEQEALITLDEYALICFLKRKKYGPFFIKEYTNEIKNKQMNAARRQGFSYGQLELYFSMEQEEIEEALLSVRMG